MRWSKRTPEVEGTYWKKEGQTSKARVVELNIYSLQFLKTMYESPSERKQNMVNYSALNYPNDSVQRDKWANKSLEDFTDYWYGPINPPEFVLTNGDSVID